MQLINIKEMERRMNSHSLEKRDVMVNEEIAGI